MKKQSLDDVLAHFADPQADPVGLLADLVAALRPVRASDTEDATRNLRALCHLLDRRPEWRAALRETLCRLLASKKSVSLYVEAGVFPNTGFFSETARRWSRTLLPDVPNRDYLKDIVGLIFDRSDDAEWVAAVDPAVWQALLLALKIDDEGWVNRKPVPPAALQLLEALRVLSYRISSIGLEPELLRVEPNLEAFASPFLAQNIEVIAYIEHYCESWVDPTQQGEDEKHLLVLMAQCAEILEKIRGRAGREGTSLSLTFLLRRLHQHLQRLECVLNLLSELHQSRRIDACGTHIVALWVALIRAESRKNNLGHYWQQNVELLARRVTENAGRTGEHYITSNRREYFVLLRSAMLAGVIIAVMALFKLLISKAHLPPLTEALAFSFNYGLGFVLIHTLHGTVATKQPAMTANTIAATLSEKPSKGHKQRNLDSLVSLIARLVRSQFAAIVGNVLLAIPMAMLIGFVLQSVSGHPFITPEKATVLLEEIHPLYSGAFFYAGIAGVCLFLAGLIAGYYDNMAAYNRIPQRLMQLKWPRRIFGEARMRRVAHYVEDNLGALAGNFFFGFLLGGVSGLGVLLGLPVDIRHIAFSSAFVGYSAVGLNFQENPLWPWAAAGVALIGVMNLCVSFSLALYVALKARGVTFSQGRMLAKKVLKHFWHHPRDFFLPPKPNKALMLSVSPIENKTDPPESV